MNKRLLTAAIGIALCALTAPANARTRMNDDDDGGRSYRQRQYDRSYDRDDESTGCTSLHKNQHTLATIASEICAID